MLSFISISLIIILSFSIVVFGAKKSNIDKIVLVFTGFYAQVILSLILCELAFGRITDGNLFKVNLLISFLLLVIFKNSFNGHLFKNFKSYFRSFKIKYFSFYLFIIFLLTIITISYKLNVPMDLDEKYQIIAQCVTNKSIFLFLNQVTVNDMFGVFVALFLKNTACFYYFEYSYLLFSVIILSSLIEKNVKNSHFKYLALLYIIIPSYHTNLALNTFILLSIYYLYVFFIRPSYFKFFLVSLSLSMLLWCGFSTIYSVGLCILLVLLFMVIRKYDNTEFKHDLDILSYLGVGKSRKIHRRTTRKLNIFLIMLILLSTLAVFGLPFYMKNTVMGIENTYGYKVIFPFTVNLNYFLIAIGIFLLYFLKVAFYHYLNEKPAYLETFYLFLLFYFGMGAGYYDFLIAAIIICVCVLFKHHELPKKNTAYFLCTLLLVFNSLCNLFYSETATVNSNDGFYQTFISNYINENYSDKKIAVFGVKPSIIFWGEKLKNMINIVTEYNQNIDADYLIFLETSSIPFSSTPWVHDYDYIDTIRSKLFVYKKLNRNETVNLNYQSFFNQITLLSDEKTNKIIIDDKSMDCMKNKMNTVALANNEIDLNSFDLTNSQEFLRYISSLKPNTIVVMSLNSDTEIRLDENSKVALSILGVNYIDQFLKNENFILISSISNNVEIPLVYREVDKPLVKHIKLKTP